MAEETTTQQQNRPKSAGIGMTVDVLQQAVGVVFHSAAALRFDRSSRTP